MYRKLLLPGLLTLTLCCTSACTHYYYAPNTLQTPFLQEQHDTQASLSFIGGDEFSGWEGHLLYSPVKYGAVMFNHFQVSHGQATLDVNEDWGKGRLTELAVGAYYPAGKTTSFSLFGGWGGGSVLNTYAATGRSELQFRRWFLQPGFAFQSKWAHLGLALRLNRLEYHNGDITFDIGEDHLKTIGNIEREAPLFVPEIGLTFGLGTNPVWFKCAFNFNTMQDKEEYGFARSTVALILQFDLDYFWRAEKEKTDK